VPYRLPGYEISTRKVAERLGIELLDLKSANCCGLPIENVDYTTSVALSARILCLAEEEGLDVVTICNGCYGKLARVNEQLKESREFRFKINKTLENVGLEYKGKVGVKHFVRVLTDDLGLEKLKEEIRKPFEGLRVAVHYGCHLLKPSKYLDVKDPEFPNFVDDLIKVTGAKTVEYDDKGLCCGGAVLAIREEISLRLAAVKFSNIRDVDANVMITTCPFCFVMYNRNQARAGEVVGDTFNIQVAHFTQLLGLALGLQEEELELRESVTNPETLLKYLT
jgi:heterodisulfide reductase subunit B